MVILVALLLLGVLESTLVTEAADPSHRAQFFSPATDPLGDKDIYTHVNEADRIKYWSEDDGRLLVDRAKDLENVEMNIGVEVRLIDFDGDGNMALSVAEEELQRFFDATPSTTPVGIVDNQGLHGNTSHELPLRTHHVYHVSRAGYTLADKIRNAIHDALPETPGHGEHKSIPHKIVDDLIREDFEKEGLSYTIYIINPIPKADESTFTYDYVTNPDGDEHHGNTKGKRECGFSMWPGRGHYIWIDLSAGPCIYGPHTSGDGLVLQYNLPRLSTHLDHHTGEIKTWEFLADVVAFTRMVSLQLISPPMQRFPIRYAPTIRIHLHIIHDRPDDDNHKSRFNWNYITNTVEALAMPGQRFDFSVNEVSFKHCEQCVSAYTHSLKSHTSNVVRKGLRTQVHQYLDSHELHKWLRHYDSAFSGEHGPGVRDIPVYLFDLSSKRILLLDRFHQALSYPDMVVAVQTRGSRPLTDFHCNSDLITLKPNDVTRPLLSALLQTGWGVAPTQLSWSWEKQATTTNWAPAISNTPYGPFASTAQLSFAQIDAGKRNILYSALNDTLGSVSYLFEHFSQFEMDIETVLTPSDHQEFVRRWNVFTYKLDRCKEYMSLHNFDQALYYVRSSRHDVNALHRIIHAAGKDLKTFLLYKHTPEARSVTLDVIIWCCCAAALIVAGTKGYVMSRRNRPKKLL